MRAFEVLPAANAFAAQETSRWHQVHANLVEAIARGRDQTRRLSLPTASDADR